MSDVFSSYSRSPGDPATSVFEIVPDDAADLASVTTALNVATSGTVRITTVDGDVTDIRLQSGVHFPLRVRKVWQTGTSATGIRGLV